MTLLQLVGEPLLIHGVGTPAEIRDRVAELLQVVGLRPEYITRYPHAFSGGQRQRIGIARALALNPSFIAADEAVSALDVSVAAQNINLMQDLQEKFGLTYLFITHDLGMVEHISDRRGNVSRPPDGNRADRQAVLHATAPLYRGADGGRAATGPARQPHAPTRAAQG